MKLREMFFDVSKNKLKSAKSREIYFGKKSNAFSFLISFMARLQKKH